jgi:alkylation response protein AidB-like acyl-CoA dehydrogenase
MFADMVMEIQAARLLAWSAAWKIDKGVSATMDAAIAKCYATDMALRVTTDCVQLLGGYGYMKEYPTEKYMRDAKILQIVEGTNQIQRMVIASSLL